MVSDDGANLLCCHYSIPNCKLQKKSVSSYSGLPSHQPTLWIGGTSFATIVDYWQATGRDLVSFGLTASMSESHKSGSDPFLLPIEEWMPLLLSDEDLFTSLLQEFLLQHRRHYFDNCWIIVLLVTLQYHSLVIIIFSPYKCCCKHPVQYIS